VIFYCANTLCSASHHAAKKAILLGWTNVRVIPEGIFGWVRVGRPVEPAS
jgi:rhodanese-related sulfurtransferase